MKKTQTYVPMRLPTNREWNRLIEVTGGDDSVIHWENMASWVYNNELGPNRPERTLRGYSSACRCHFRLASSQDGVYGFRPAIDITDADTLLSGLKDGDSAIIGTLFMNEQPVRVPKNPIDTGDIQKYTPGAALEMRSALDNPDYQVVGIRVGNAIIADRNLLSMISYKDIEDGIGKGTRAKDTVPPQESKIMKEIQPDSPMRIPVDNEWDRLVDVTGGSTHVIHWEKMLSWVNKVCATNPTYRARCGYSSNRNCGYGSASYRDAYLGFRPAIDIAGADTLLSGLKDGDSAIIGTLFMNGQPVRVPKNPIDTGDIQKYAPGAALEMRPALDDPSYQVVGIRVGNAVIADRNLLSMISYKDIEDGIGKGTRTKDTMPPQESKIMKEIQPDSPMRIPVDDEWDQLVKVTGGGDSIIHWVGIRSWVSGTSIKYRLPKSPRATRGGESAQFCKACPQEDQYVNVGFRPAFDLKDNKLRTAIKNGEPVIMGTLYMNDQPVKVPECPDLQGDIQEYVSCATLEMRPALDDPSYQVVGIRVGGTVIADRNMLKMISYEDIERGIIGPKKDVSGCVKRAIVSYTNLPGIGYKIEAEGKRSEFYYLMQQKGALENILRLVDEGYSIQFDGCTLTSIYRNVRSVQINVVDELASLTAKLRGAIGD